MAKQTIYNAGIYVRLSQEDMRAGDLFIPQCGPAAADVAHRAQSAVDAAGVMGDHPHKLLGHPPGARFSHRHGNDPQSPGR